MSEYFISRPDDNEWSLDIEAFARKLQERWPNIRLRSYPAQAEWDIKEEEYVIVGELYFSPGPVVCIDGELKGCAEFALWYRQQIPADQLIWFYDDELSNHVVLDNETTIEQIVNAFED